MKYITFLNILSKTIFTISIFIFVEDKLDIYKVPLITSVGLLVSGVLSLRIIKNSFGVLLVWQSWRIQKKYLLDGWGVFVSRLFVNLYTTTNILLLGIFTNTTVIGYYSIAEKIVNAVGGLFSPANQALYPFLAKIYSNKKYDKFQKLIKSISLIYIFSSISLFVTLYLFGDFIIEVITGSKNINISQIYYILVFSIITSPFGAFYTQILLIQKRNDEFNRIVRNTFLFSMMLSPALIYLYEGVGLAVAIVLSQLFVISLCLIAIKKGTNL